MDLILYVEQATLSEPSIASDKNVQEMRSKIFIWQPGTVRKIARKKLRTRPFTLYCAPLVSSTFGRGERVG
jgi:hypothetical protein